MFGRGKRMDTQINGFIGKGVTLNGKLGFEGTVRIDGSFEGEIDAGGILIVGEEGKIQARIKVDTAIISGEVRGDLEAATRVELKAPSRVYGNIKTPSLVIGDGVLFCGTSIMGEGVAMPEGISTAGSIGEAKEWEE